MPHDSVAGMVQPWSIRKSDENEKLPKIYMYCKANLTYGEVIEMINIAITKRKF